MGIWEGHYAMHVSGILQMGNEKRHLYMLWKKEEKARRYADMGVQGKPLKILATADWHIGNFRGPAKDGVNLRLEDTKRCLDELVRVAQEERPDFSLISGDVFHVGRLWSDRCCEEIIIAAHYIRELAAASGQAVVMRGTPNHDGSGQFTVLSEMFAGCPGVHVVDAPQVLHFGSVDIAALPGFDSGVYRAKFPGLSKEEENAAFTQELSNIVLGLKAQCSAGKESILMAHYTVPGCNAESGQTMLLTQFEPVLQQETLLAAGYSLVALGHIHRPQQVAGQEWYYPGAVNQLNFNDEGQERGFWVHRKQGPGCPWEHVFHRTPAREHITFRFGEADIAAINMGGMDGVAMAHWRHNGAAQGRIARVLYTCTAEEEKAYKMNGALLERTLLGDGAFMLWENLPAKALGTANRAGLAKAAGPEENLIKFLEEKQAPPEKVQALVHRARPVIAEAEAGMAATVGTGVFEPVEISVRNYRNYAEETFSFEGISFCTINGPNGAGKSSLFMDAIMDCLYEEPREGDKAGWLRNDGKARSGSIMFTFRVGEKTFRVTRTRARSGRGTLNISQLIGDAWEDCSKEKYGDTQKEVLDIIGMDSLTFRSCALVMQDQYGLFLQAKPEGRVEVLGTLLGLGAYRAMEKIAADRAKESAAKGRGLGQEAEACRRTLASLGDPDAELETCKAELGRHEGSLQAKTVERDRQKLALAGQQEAAERRAKLLASITALQGKKTAAEQSRATQQDIVATSTAILSGKADIEAKVAEYNRLLEKQKELSAGATLYSSKLAELTDLENQVGQLESQLSQLEVKLQGEESRKAALEVPVDETLIRNNVAEYEKYSRLLHQMEGLQTKWIEAKSNRDRKAYSADSKRAYINQEIQRLNGKKSDLERRAELLQDSGCSNIDNAECRFLADALDARKQIPVIENEIAAFKQEQLPLLQDLYADVDEAEKAVDSVGYDETLLVEYSTRVQSLAGFPAQMKAIEERANQIALISASIQHIQSNISDCENRLAMARLKAAEATQERSNYAKAFEEHTIVNGNILSLGHWLEKEKEIPVAQERYTTALARVSELTVEISNIDNEIAEKLAEADKETRAMAGMEGLAGTVAKLDAEVEALNSLVKEKQMEAGALQQKSGQAAKLEKEIAGLQGRQARHAKEAAEYEALKAAFSQSGIPHQIIRSAIPQLSGTANSILGQMTGGKMGIEFRLERMQKNGKEKETLDIFIGESGAPPLPYLSKSGGEKVKASLSVALALAEAKSSAAGVQLGMLFIDEPPFLDSDGMQAYCDALEAIQGRYRGIKIMAITHDPAMKSRFPQSVDIIRTGDGSKVAC